MDWEAIHRCFGTIVNKQKQTLELIDKICREIRRAINSIPSINYSEFPFGHRTVLTELRDNLRALNPLDYLDATEHVMKMYIIEYRQLLDETMDYDISIAYRNHVEFDDASTLNQIIINHFYREGLFDVADCFSEEANEKELNILRLHFEESHQILKALESKNIEPALTWITENEGALDDLGSGIKLKLHKVKFVDMVENGMGPDALQYAMTNLDSMRSSDPSELQRLAGSLMWAGRLHESSFSDLLDPIHLQKLINEFWQILCDYTAQSCNDPLSVVVTAGAEALLPLIDQAEQAESEGEDWQTMAGLYTPLPLRTEYRFHSMLICRTCQDLSCGENPPQLLTCGHVLCTNCAWESIVLNSSCFLCEREITEWESCKQLYF